MGGNQGIEQVLGKLVELLSAKTSETSSSNREIVTHVEPVQKLELIQMMLNWKAFRITWLGQEGHYYC